MFYIGASTNASILNKEAYGLARMFYIGASTNASNHLLPLSVIELVEMEGVGGCVAFPKNIFSPIPKKPKPETRNQTPETYKVVNSILANILLSIIDHFSQRTALFLTYLYLDNLCATIFQGTRGEGRNSITNYGYH